MDVEITTGDRIRAITFNPQSAIVVNEADGYRWGSRRVTQQVAAFS
ncbi:MAG: hypothetical protein ICV55_05915 [Coleofasciculus sp. C3-bin4]|nr:hypothetical protein [Coleofasciculus sp. C3-bin4]